MSEFFVEVVKIGAVEKHPNADRLELTTVHNGYTVAFQKGTYKEGDLAVYVPVDAVVPNTDEWMFLAPAGAAELRDKDRRIKAKRLRGVFSMGLLTDAPKGAEVGQDVAKALGITRWEEPEPTATSPYKGSKSGQPVPWSLRRLWRSVYWFVVGLIWPSKRPPKPGAAPKLPVLPGMYDIEPFRRYGQSLFQPGELVVVTEKIHGQNASFVHDGTRLFIKSRNRWLLTEPGTSTWADVAAKYDLAKKLADYPGILLFGETYGNNADMPYGVDRSKTGDAFMAFDAFDTKTGGWLDFYETKNLCNSLDVPHVPELFSFRWDTNTSYSETLPAAEGKSTVPGANHVREGFVIKPAKERHDPRFGRVILKMAGEGYHTRKVAA